jgi:hypothetical protein
MRSIATVETASARRYLGQFVKHFAHKLPAELAEDSCSGEVTFGAGTCQLLADEAGLTLALDAEPEAMTQLQDVAARHLVRFAFREELRINWRQVQAA